MVVVLSGEGCSRRVLNLSLSSKHMITDWSMRFLSSSFLLPLLRYYNEMVKNVLSVTCWEVRRGTIILAGWATFLGRNFTSPFVKSCNLNLFRGYPRWEPENLSGTQIKLAGTDICCYDNFCISLCGFRSHAMIAMDSLMWEAARVPIYSGCWSTCRSRWVPGSLSHEAVLFLPYRPSLCFLLFSWKEKPPYHPYLSLSNKFYHTRYLWT
jgi:hypothetical protein